MAARGVAWTGGGQILRQIIQIAGQLVLARMLAPQDFGLLGMAMFFIGIGQLIADFGVGSAIVQSQTRDSLTLSSCFWVNMALVAVLAAVMAVAAPLIGSFYQRPDLTPLVAVLSLNLVLSGLLVMPFALLTRDLRFAHTARAQVLGSLMGALSAVALAWSGAGVWALVAQPLVGSTATLLAAWWSHRWLPQLAFSWHAMAPLARFSFALLGTNLVGYGNRSIDSLLIGRFLGAGPLGVYAMAIQIMLYPLQQISSVIVRVLFPTLVQIKDDLPRLRGAYLKAVSTIALITFPLMSGLYAVADDFVLLVFGPTWAGMTPVLKVLCWVGLMQSVGTTVGAIYLSTGNPGVALKVSLLGAPVLVVGIAAGIPWGIEGVAVGYAISTVVLFYYVALQAFKLIGLSLVSFHLALIRPFITSMLVCFVLLGLAEFTGHLPVVMRFMLAMAVGLLTFSSLSLAINRGQLLEIWHLASSIRRRT
jgi:PST family polysaccharide transporter